MVNLMAWLKVVVWCVAGDLMAYYCVDDVSAELQKRNAGYPWLWGTRRAGEDSKVGFVLSLCGSSGV